MSNGYSSSAPSCPFRHRRQRNRAPRALVEAHSGELRKELGLADLTLTQVLFIVGLPWVGVAAKQGPAHVVLWLVAIVLFYLPSAAVVIHLNRAMPLEGGLYQWAKLGFNELTGFLVAWNLWLFAILNTSEIGLQVTQYLRYILGPRGEWLTGNTLVRRRVVSTVHPDGAGRRDDPRAERRQVGAQGGRRADAGDVRDADGAAVAERRARIAGGSSIRSRPRCR